MMSKEEYKAKWQNEMRESEGPCKVFSFDSKDLANPACGEALAEMGMFGKRSATAREEEQPPAKKPREPEPLEPEPVLREKFDKDFEERVKAQFQLMKVIAEFFTIAEAQTTRKTAGEGAKLRHGHVHVGMVEQLSRSRSRTQAPSTPLMSWKC